MILVYYFQQGMIKTDHALKPTLIQTSVVIRLKEKAPLDTCLSIWMHQYPGVQRSKV